MDAVPLGPASPAYPSSARALALLSPPPVPISAPQPSEVAANETPTQSNANRLLQSMTNCLNGAFPQGDAHKIQFYAA
jgi:hypothetical protein